jgi:hypothetical protein
LTPKRWSRIREIFDAAIAHSAPEVKAYIRDTSAGDDELLSEIRRMLEEHAQTGTLDRPVWRRLRRRRPRFRQCSPPARSWPDVTA